MRPPAVRARDFALATGFANQLVCSGRGELVGWSLRDSALPTADPTSQFASSATAGSDFIFTGSATRPTQLVSLIATLTTSAVAGNRNPVLRFRDAGPNNMGRFAAPADQIASTVVTYTWGPGLGNQNAATPLVQTIATPVGLVVPATGSIGTQTTGLLGGDQWSNINLVMSTIGGASVTLHDGNAATAPEIANLTTGTAGSNFQTPTVRGIGFESGLFVRTLAGAPTLTLYVAPELRIADDVSIYVPDEHSY